MQKCLLPSFTRFFVVSDAIEGLSSQKFSKLRPEGQVTIVGRFQRLFHLSNNSQDLFTYFFFCITDHSVVPDVGIEIAHAERRSITET